MRAWASLEGFATRSLLRQAPPTTMATAGDRDAYPSTTTRLAYVEAFDRLKMVQ